MVSALEPEKDGRMRLIDADALIELLTTAIRIMKGMAKFIGAEDDPEIQMEIKAYTDIANGVKDMPTIEERKKGKWIHIRCNMYECPECSRTYTALTPDDSCDADFCPNCGAKMEKK